MSSLQSVVGALPGYVVYFAAMLVAAAQLAVVLSMLRTKQQASRIFAAALHFATWFFFFSVFVDYSYNALILERPEVMNAFEVGLLSLPWLLYLALELVSAAAIYHHVRSFTRYLNAHPTPDAIRQTLDLLPAGLMIGDADGTVLLANIKMTELCRELTGELLSDAKRFWQHVENASEQGLIRTATGEAWQFAKNTIALEGKEYDQVTATDMTEQSRVTEELSRNNQHLQEVQDRMKAVTAKERNLAAAREVMNARMTVHNRMGAVLLSGKYYLDHPDDVKEEELLHLLEYSNSFILGEAEQHEVTDSVEKAIQLARRIGVEVEISGELPQGETIRDLLAQAIDQCAANAVRHAGGDCLSIAIAEHADVTTIEVSNNGSAPDGPIVETGGLAVLRSAAEARGASMKIQATPAFLLSLSIPKRP